MLWNIVPSQNTDILNGGEYEEKYGTVSYKIISDVLADVVNGIKIPIDVKNEIQRNIHEKQERHNIQGISAMVDVLSKVSPGIMEQAQEEDLEISKVMHYVKLGRKPLSGQD